MLNYDMLNEIDKCIIRHMPKIFDFKIFQLYCGGNMQYAYKFITISFFGKDIETIYRHFDH